MESFLDTLASGMLVLQHAVVSHCKTFSFKTSLSLSNFFLFPEKKKGGNKKEERKGVRGVESEKEERRKSG